MVDQIAHQEDDFYVWPDNWPAIELFCDCETQWRWAEGQKVGLDYKAVIGLMVDVYDVSRETRREMLAGVKLMELAAMKAWESANPPPKQPSQPPTGPRPLQ